MFRAGDESLRSESVRGRDVQTFRSYGAKERGKPKAINISSLTGLFKPFIKSEIRIPQSNEERRSIVKT